MEAFGDLPTQAFDSAIAVERTSVLRAKVAAAREPSWLGGELAAGLPAIGERVAEVAGGPAGLSGVRESDLVLFALLQASRSEVDGRWLRREFSSGLSQLWCSPKGRPVGPWDLSSGAGGHATEAVEAKWICSDKSHELLWDVLKLGQGIALGQLESGYLLVGITEAEYRRPDRPTKLLGGGSWATRSLMTAHAKSWQWNGAQTRPVGGLPAGIATTPLTEPVAVGNGGLVVLVQVGASEQTVAWDEATNGLLGLPPRD